MLIADRIVINVPAERIFAHMCNIEHKRLDENCEPSIIADSTRTIFFKRTVLNFVQRAHLSSENFYFGLAELDPYRKISISPTHWYGKYYLPGISYEFDELAGRTEVISTIKLPFGLLDVRLKRKSLLWLKNKLKLQSSTLKRRMEYC